MRPGEILRLRTARSYGVGPRPGATTRIGWIDWRPERKGQVMVCVYLGNEPLSPDDGEGLDPALELRGMGWHPGLDLEAPVDSADLASAFAVELAIRLERMALLPGRLDAVREDVEARLARTGARLVPFGLDPSRVLRSALAFAAVAGHPTGCACEGCMASWLRAPRCLPGCVALPSAPSSGASARHAPGCPNAGPGAREHRPGCDYPGCRVPDAERHARPHKPGTCGICDRMALEAERDISSDAQEWLAKHRRARGVPKPRAEGASGWSLEPGARRPKRSTR